MSTTAKGMAVRASRRPLQEAAQVVRQHTRVARLAVEARVAQAAHEWWQAEEAWCELPVEEKRRRGRRRDPWQLLLPGMPTGQRAYPRRIDGRPDHAEARRIEASRIGAPGLTAHALQLAAAGELVDPARLDRDGARSPEQTVTRRRRRRTSSTRRPAARPAARPRGTGWQLELPSTGDGRPKRV